MSKNQLERILEIDRIIRDRGSCTKREAVARFEVSEKSVERDLAYMRDRLGAPLEYNRMSDQYVYSDTSYFLPAVSLSKGEAMALSLSSEILNHFTPVKDFQNLRSSFRRLAGYLPNEIQVDLSHLNNRVTVILEQQSRLPSDVWATMMVCVRENRQVKVDYRKPDSRSSEEKILEPYYLVAFRGSWYIIAATPGEEKIRTYALSRMKNPRKLKKTFTIPPDFTLADYIDPEWGIYSRKETYDFKLKFTPHAASIIREKTWHRNQRIEDHDDGSLTLSFTTGQIETVGQWVMSWGSDVVVLGPGELVESIRKTVLIWIDKYSI